MPDPSRRLSATLVDRYGIERELGRGGMATVFLDEPRQAPTGAEAMAPAAGTDVRRR